MTGVIKLAKKFDGIVKPRLTRWCKSCGKMFTARHVVDDEQYCEECRANECKQQENRN